MPDVIDHCTRLVVHSYTSAVGQRGVHQGLVIARLSRQARVARQVRQVRQTRQTRQTRLVFSRSNERSMHLSKGLNKVPRESHGGRDRDFATRGTNLRHNICRMASSHRRDVAGTCHRLSSAPVTTPPTREAEPTFSCPGRLVHSCAPRSQKGAPVAISDAT